MTLTITSQAFVHEGSVPAKYTCEASDVSPPLAWSGVPDTSKSLVLIVDDPDAPDPKAPKMTWVHWVLYDIPPSTRSLIENADKLGLPAGTRIGMNDWKRQAYGGPCPPIGRHRYFHKLYCLDITLTALNAPTKADVEKAMTGHILAEAVLMGTYQKSGK